MPSLKEIRNRITSVGSTMQITSAMKMVSAAKLKRAQDAITQMRPYSVKLQEILSNLSATLDLSENAYSDNREVKNVLIVGITSNRGLCGGFNNNIIKRVNQLVNHDFKDANPRVLCLGKKIKDAYKRSDAYFINDALAPVEDIFNQLTFENNATIAAELMHLFVTKEFDKIVVVYNQFVNAATQDVKTEEYLPIIPTVSEGTSSAGDYIFEPSKEEIVSDLIPKSLKIQLFKSLLDSNASEHGARMTAMHKATDNASELQKNLKLSYNKARQAAITNEILEIVGGAEALNG
ncbi:MAG: ATP synthase F1 subunit gamma [Crocinitomicaceae bacterium]|jgi:F-type H+-transporting ATPase subunit gamma|nr:ATP synthase F1 subunit gamma [Crocinitomicaceae bacterium]